MARTPGPDAIRNGQLRAALKRHWPQVKFAVRNGQGGWAAVRWADGPTENAVRAVVKQVLAPDGYPCGVSLYRTCSDELVAVAIWRAWRRGEPNLYRELDPDTGRTLPQGSTPLPPRTLSTRRAVEEDEDGATITDLERTTAMAILAVTGLRAGQGHRANAIARTVVLQGSVVEGILA